MIVAIDGPAGSGKSAVGRRLAARLKLPFVDSGLFYRLLACAAQKRGLGEGAPDRVRLEQLASTLSFELSGSRLAAGGDDFTASVYSPQTSAFTSAIASFAEVRAALLPQQRRLATGGVVMAGRDIGTVVLPEADFKFFLTASTAERVRRRARQLEARGEQVDPAVLTEEVVGRDRQDSEREVAPLRAAADAQVIETDHLGVDQVVDLMYRRVSSGASA